MDVLDDPPKISLPIKIKETIGKLYEHFNYPEEPLNPDEEIVFYLWTDCEE